MSAAISGKSNLNTLEMSHKNRGEAERPINSQVMEAAKLYEAQFIREMVRAMRKTVPKSDLINENPAEKLYREKLDDNTVDNWVESGGVGLARIIHDQILDRYSAVMPRSNKVSTDTAISNYKAQKSK